MGEISLRVVQTVRRTRREAEAALLHAREETAALRRHLATLPSELLSQPSYRALLAHLDELDASREHAIALVAQHAGRFES
jgi:hypothetical protein